MHLIIFQYKTIVLTDTENSCTFMYIVVHFTQVFSQLKKIKLQI